MNPAVGLISACLPMTNQKLLMAIATFLSSVATVNGKRNGECDLMGVNDNPVMQLKDSSKMSMGSIAMLTMVIFMIGVCFGMTIGWSIAMWMTPKGTTPVLPYEQTKINDELLDEEGEFYITVGKHANAKIKDLPLNYVKWLLANEGKLSHGDYTVVTKRARRLGLTLEPHPHHRHAQGERPRGHGQVEVD